MTLLIDIKAFLTSARVHGFSSAARELRTTPSVISKRVGRLEEEIGIKLFRRTTRALTLTPEGESLQPRLQELVAQLDDVLFNHDRSGIRGALRIRSTTTMGTAFVGAAVNRFQAVHPGITIELLLIDRPVNPLEEDFDISFGALPQSFGGVIEKPMCPYPRVLVAAPGYLDKHGRPQKPADIVNHDCLVFVPVGHTWTFSSPSGAISVDIHPHYTVNDSRILVDAAINGLGLAIVPDFLAREPLEDGQLVKVMPDYPVIPIWFKAMVPRHKALRPEVVALIEHIQKESETAPWV
ncbi:LysR family transcriptional regulator [Roseibium marinum]|uniref:DNA-binding transcriptional LysR family regulator n=1 Tax=Roseibium marinum TaxID=281252 RepID=A0A2S3UK67_9HYPH|nr:LysR family transcriptional regulator [Roseibium marinum]POF27973.1 DNA-binding transcriptional LysR family regulator [Roseibium marinum]